MYIRLVGLLTRSFYFENEKIKRNSLIGTRWYILASMNCLHVIKCIRNLIGLSLYYELRLKTIYIQLVWIYAWYVVAHQFLYQHAHIAYWSPIITFFVCPVFCHFTRSKKRKVISNTTWCYNLYKCIVNTFFLVVNLSI